MYKSRLKTQPAFHYSRLEDVGETPVIIHDVAPEIWEKRCKDFQTTGLKKPVIRKVEDLAYSLDQMMGQLLLPETTTLFVFPGRGGIQASNISRICQDYRGVRVHAQRFWKPGNDPICTVGEILADRIIQTEVELVVVLDDVISSGKTMALLCERNAWKLPRAQWIGCAWMSQLQRSRHPSGIKGYKAIYTACLVVRADGKRVPINSLSTLLDDPHVAESYRKRYSLVIPDA